MSLQTEEPSSEATLALLSGEIQNLQPKIQLLTISGHLSHRESKILTQSLDMLNLELDKLIAEAPKKYPKRIRKSKKQKTQQTQPLK